VFRRYGQCTCVASIIFDISVVDDDDDDDDDDNYPRVATAAVDQQCCLTAQETHWLNCVWYAALFD
jgi:hypothetical protein